VSLLWPYGLAALAGVPAAILIALWRARRRDLTVPSLMLWDRLAEKVSEAGRKHRKLVDASLVLAAVFAALAGLAVAGPMLTAPAEPGRTLLLVADRSASMNMKQGGSTRWDLAVRELGKLLGELTPADTVYLATSPLGDTVLVGPLRPDGAIERLQKMQPTDRPGDIVKDVTRTLASARALKPFVAVVCTDTPEILEADAGPIGAIGVGGPIDNAFFTRFGSSKDEVVLGVKAVGGRRRVTLRLTADDRILGEEALEIADGTEETVAFKAPELVDAQWVEARIMGDDSLAADNYFYAARQPQGRIRVLFIGQTNLFVERALEVHPGVELVRGGEPKEATEPLPYDLLVYNGTSPKKIPECSTVVINPPDSFGPITVAGALKNPVVTGVTQEELTGDAGLSEITVAAARRITGGRDIVVDSDKGPLVIADENVVCLAFDISPENTKWMYTPGFAVFWLRLLERVSPARRPGLTWTRLGEESPTAAPQSVRAVRKRPGSGLVAQPNGGEIPFRPDFAGVYELTSGAEKSLVAFNMLAPGESSTRGSSKVLDSKILNAEAGTRAAHEMPMTAAVMAIAVMSVMMYWYLRR